MHTGEISIATNKQLMVITEYNESTDLTVQFEDETIINHKRYNHFKTGKITNPNNPTDRYQERFKKQMKNRLGTTVTAANGIEMTIIAYRRSDDIDVQFEDGTIVKHKQYKHFLKGKIGNPNIDKGQVFINRKKDEHIGETLIHKSSGMRMTIINYENINDIDVKFEDGAILRHQKYRCAKIGQIKHPKYNAKQYAANRHIGRQIITKNGTLAVVTSYENCKSLTVMFENGIKIKSANTHNIQNRKTIPDHIGDIHLDELAFFYDGEYYYICSSPKWNNDRKILSVSQIYNEQK